MNLIKLLMLSILLVFSFSLTGCQGNNSDSPESNTTVPDTNGTTPVIDANATKDPTTLQFVYADDINVTSSGQIVTVKIRAFSKNNTLDTEGSISVQFPLKPDAGSFSPNTASIVDGIATFTYTAPTDLQGRVDAGDISSDYTFYSTEDTTVQAKLHVGYSPTSAISTQDPVLNKLTLSDSSIDITQSGESVELTLMAYTDQNTTNIGLDIGIQYSSTGDIGYFTPANPVVVDGRVTLTYTGPENLLEISKSLSKATFTLYDKVNPGITATLDVNFAPSLPTIRVESPTVVLTENSQSKTVTLLAFDSVTKKAFESGTIIVTYPDAIANGTLSGGTFTQAQADISNGKAVFEFEGPDTLATIANQIFTFKYKENQSVTADLTIQYKPTLPQIATLAIDEQNTIIAQDQQVHTVTINALDANGDFVTDGTINVKFPTQIANGTDLGTFTELSADVVNGQAKFTYTGPKSVLTTSSAIKTGEFKFSDAAGVAADISWNVTFDPDIPVIRLASPTITLTEDAQSVTVQVLAFNENNQSLDAGTISVAYPSEIINDNANGGRFLENEVSIEDGQALFTFQGPTTLENINALTFTFSYQGNTLVATKDLLVEYTPPTATLVLTETTKELTLNSQTVTIDVDVIDSDNNPFPTGSVKVVYPDDVKLGRDIGNFISSEIELVNGKAEFVYTAPKNLDANDSDILFKFYHDSLPSITKDYRVTFNPEDGQIIQTDYFLTSSYSDGNITMDLDSTTLITFYVKDKDGNLLGDSNISSIEATILNTPLADLADTNASGIPAETKTIYKNSQSLSILSDTISGVVPIKVLAKFKGVNNEDINITEIFNVVIVSGPPTAMSISYVSTSNDTNSSKYVEKMIVALTDKYSNRVNSNPGLSVSLIAGYAPDTSGSMGYMYHETGGTIDATDKKFKVNSGAVMKAEITNYGSGYLSAPSVSLSGGDGTFEGSAHLASYGGIHRVDIVNRGRQYTKAPTISAEGIGRGFVATAVLETTGSFFTTKSSTTTGNPIITLDNAGSGYTTEPTISVTNPGSGSGFKATAILDDTGTLSSATIVNKGSGFAVGDTLTINAECTTPPVIKVKEVNASGAINVLDIQNYGSECKSITLDELVKGAEITFTIGHPLKEIELISGGSGYSDDSITISTEDSTQVAKASASIGYSIASITVEKAGAGYRTPTILFSDEGDGENASARAVVAYPLSHIEITNAGSGYDSSDALTLSPADIGVDNATAKAVFFPSFDTVKENSGTNDDFLVTFGNGYTYNASGKWDITKNSDKYELSLVDIYDGNTTDNLGFAIGNNYRQDSCIAGQEWVAKATTPVAEFNSNGLAEVYINYDYYLAAKDIMLAVNLVGTQNSTGETVKFGEAIKHTLRGGGLVADTLTLPAGIDHGVYKMKVYLDGTSEPLRNANFTYTVASTSLGLTIHSVHNSMEDNIASCPLTNDEGRAYVEIEVSTSAISTITLDNLVISREFK